MPSGTVTSVTKVAIFVQGAGVLEELEGAVAAEVGTFVEAGVDCWEITVEGTTVPGPAVDEATVTVMMAGSLALLEVL